MCAPSIFSVCGRGLASDPRRYDSERLYSEGAGESGPRARGARGRTENGTQVRRAIVARRVSGARGRMRTLYADRGKARSRRGAAAAENKPLYGCRIPSIPFPTRRKVPPAGGNFSAAVRAKRLGVELRNADGMPQSFATRRGAFPFRRERGIVGATRLWRIRAGRGVGCDFCRAHRMWPKRHGECRFWGRST